jgi:hypothetical protein
MGQEYNEKMYFFKFNNLLRWPWLSFMYVINPKTLNVIMIFKKQKKKGKKKKNPFSLTGV